MSTLEQEGEEVVGQARCPFESRQSNVGLFAGECILPCKYDAVQSDSQICRGHVQMTAVPDLDQYWVKVRKNKNTLSTELCSFGSFRKDMEKLLFTFMCPAPSLTSFSPCSRSQNPSSHTLTNDLISWHTNFTANHVTWIKLLKLSGKNLPIIWIQFLLFVWSTLIFNPVNLAHLQRSSSNSSQPTARPPVL